MAALAELTDTISVAADAISTNFELQQLAAVPMHRYVAAFERLQRVTTAELVVSPIPAG
ncbi:hypothetical protein [Burkholderia pyrrocinia]|uniref:hypothetical protein n=1 Tax=Burkholderia pyrrocinia TaxID=60550 RepID=UPI00158B82AC|nr:hypothetical protein [Burkholderia pyrrocinia]